MKWVNQTLTGRKLFFSSIQSIHSDKNDLRNLEK